MVRRLGYRALLVAALLTGLGLGASHAAPVTGSLALLTSTAPQPTVVTVPSEGVVIWVNQTTDLPLSLTFNGTPSPDPTCPASRGFVRQNSQVFSLPALPPGGTASLCFPAAGTYTYEVHGLGHPVSGTVTVGGHP
ncbi:MAG: hypothetical protein ACE5KY_02360 [Candidatus Tectimicrobiota bacterium]